MPRLSSCCRDNFSSIYDHSRWHAQQLANRSGIDIGIEKVRLPVGGYRWFHLPNKKNRCGFELRCEVVEPERGRKCENG